MNLKLITTIAGLFVGAWALPAANPLAPVPARPPTLALFTNYTAASFRQLPVATNLISLEHLDLDLLDAAVYHETNRRRQQNGMPPLGYSPKARSMARIQARAMAAGQFVEHTNPDPKLRTMADRARAVGLHARFLGENVASAFGRHYKSGAPFFVRQENGQKIYTYDPNGPGLPPHSYITFAEALLDEWMSSAGHRRNILHKSPEYLGCACEPSPNRSTMETFYCAQAFFAPF